MENNKFLSFDGVIGRRGFIINYLLVMVIVYTVSMILNIVIIAFAPSMYNNNLGTVMNLISIFLLYPTLERRIKDLYGSTERDLSFYLLMLITIIGISTPIINILVIIALMATEGSITGKLPKSEVIKFNWGAFLGTWIWGLFNKSYKTLWMIPLCITPAAFPFSLICGIKGNEWSYKNKPVESLEKFHDSQRFQAIIWAILSPVISMIISFVLIFGSVSYIKNIEKQHPGIVITNIEKGFKSIIKAAGATIYTKFEKTPEGYKFYVNPKNWKKLSDKDKTTYYIITVYNAFAEDGQSLTSQQQLDKIIKKTKIYSSFNEELLCECNIPDDVDVNISNIVEIVQKYLKVNELPSTP